MQANLWEVLTPGSLTPVVTSTIIAAATVILNLVAGIVTERKRAELSLEVCAELLLSCNYQDEAARPAGQCMWCVATRSACYHHGSQAASLASWHATGPVS